MIRIVLAALALTACSPPPGQPALRTYGAIQPVCIFYCRQNLTLADGDGAVTLTDETTKSVGPPAAP